MKLRVIDAGWVDPLRSQSLWHGIASAMTDETPATLSFCRPTGPYVCLGYHRSLSELDSSACKTGGIRILRRQLGGGPVWIDRDQLFFQLTVPARRAALSVDRLYARFLEPAVAAFRRLGIDAERRGVNDIAVGDCKISGTAAGRIDDGVTVVGNVIFQFSHERMTDVLAFPSETMRAECLRLMRRHLASIEDIGHGTMREDEAKRAFVEAYAERLGAAPLSTELNDAELREIDRWETRMTQPSWLEGVAPRVDGVRQVKISADAWVTSSASRGMRIETSVVGGAIERILIESDGLNGLTESLQSALRGAPANLNELQRRLETFDVDRPKVLQLLRPALELR